MTGNEMALMASIAVDMQDKADKEPCNDAISRQAVLDVIYGQHIGGKEAVEHGLRNTYAGDLREIADEIIALPPVRPQETVTEYADRCRECGAKYGKLLKQKTGYWIAVENEEMETIGYYCSKCDLPMETEEQTDFCPNCGARMVEPQESEDKE